jgi:hypothetical protein
MLVVTRELQVLGSVRLLARLKNYLKKWSNSEMRKSRGVLVLVKEELSE